MSATATEVWGPAPLGVAGPADAARRLRARAPDLLAALLALAAAALWGGALPGVGLHRIGDRGLITALPPAAFAALGIVAAGFALTLRGGHVSTPVAVLHIVVLVVM